MRPALSLASLPVRAAVLHGTGEDSLEEFRNASALDVMVRFTTLGRRGLSGDGRLTEQMDAICSWLVDLPAGQLRGICEQPAFRVWLGDVERALGSSDAKANKWLGYLPYIFLTRLADIGDREWTARIPPTGRAAPLEATYRWQAVSDIEAVIRTGTGEPEVRSEAHLERVDRNFTLLDVEVFGTADFPELARENSATGTDQPAATGEARLQLAAAFDFLMEAWPECLPDVLAVFHGVVLLDAPGGHTYSASSPSAPLILQLTMRPNKFPIVLAETIVHETAHLKLHMLTEMEALLNNDEVPRYYHPWRPDLRPMKGVLLGAHAFLNVVEMYKHAITHGSKDPFVHREYETRLVEVRQALGTLAKHAEFTAAGRQVFEAMCREAGDAA